MTSISGSKSLETPVRTAPVAETVRVSLLSAPLDEAVPMSFSSLQDRRLCLVEIESEGYVGVGESWINYPAWAHEERIATLRDGVIPIVLGSDISDPVAVHESMRAVLGRVGRQWGAPGPIWQAISAIDMALWDLQGKFLGKPVSQLLGGGEPKRSIPVYGSGVGPDRVEHWCSVALDQNIRAVKVKLGFGEETDIRTLSGARSLLGPDGVLLSDANQAWSLDEAISMLEVLRAYDVSWIEEPISDDLLPDLISFASLSNISVATGENVYGTDVFERYIRSGSIDVIQPDVTKCGGITAMRSVAESAAQSKVNLAPHCYGSAIGIAASLHLAAAFPNSSWMELDVRPNPLRSDLLASPLNLVDGELLVPTGAGFGIEIDADVVDRYRIHSLEFS